MSPAQVSEVLDVLRRIARENGENKNDRGERVPFLSWGTQVALEEAIEMVEAVDEAIESGHA